MTATAKLSFVSLPAVDAFDIEAVKRANAKYKPEVVECEVVADVPDEGEYEDIFLSQALINGEVADIQVRYPAVLGGIIDVFIVDENGVPGQLVTSGISYGERNYLMDKAEERAAVRDAEELYSLRAEAEDRAYRLAVGK